MKSTLNRFLNELEQLEYYVLLNNSIGEIIKYNTLDSDSEKIKRKLTKTKSIISKLPFKKVFEYNSVIVSMYGFFEKFIEDLLVSYLNTLCNYTPKYSDLPKIIIENHSLLSAQLIQNLKIPKYENESLISIITKLERCMVKDISDLNSAAFTDHSSNFRINTISEFFGRIGIKSLGTKIKKFPLFNDYLIERFGSKINIEQTEDSIIFNILSDLAQRRNDISHGSAGGTPILNSSIYPEYFEFLKYFSKTIYSILSDSLLEFECKRDFRNVKFEAIYNHNILCVEIQNGEIKIGDRILVQSELEKNTLYFERYIEEIQIEKIPVSAVIIDKPTKIGFKLNDRVKENQKFFMK